MVRLLRGEDVLEDRSNRDRALFGLRTLEEIEAAFPGRLYDVMMARFAGAASNLAPNGPVQKQGQETGFKLLSDLVLPLDKAGRGSIDDNAVSAAVLDLSKELKAARDAQRVDPLFAVRYSRFLSVVRQAVLRDPELLYWPMYRSSMIAGTRRVHDSRSFRVLPSTFGLVCPCCLTALAATIVPAAQERRCFRFDRDLQDVACQLANEPGHRRLGQVPGRRLTAKQALDFFLQSCARWYSLHGVDLLRPRSQRSPLVWFTKRISTPLRFYRSLSTSPNRETLNSRLRTRQHPRA